MSAKLIRAGLVVLSAVVVVAFAAPSVSLADDQQKDEYDFHFSIDPLLFEAMFTDVDTASSKFEEYRDMDTGGIVRYVRLLGASADGNRTLDFEVRNAGRDDARYTMRYGSSGVYDLTLDYNVIPHRFGNQGTMLHSTIGGRDMYTISDATQLALQNAVEAQLMGGGAIDFPFLESQLQPYIDSGNRVDPQLERRRFRAALDIGKLSTMAWRIDVQQETRSGSRPYGSTFGFSNAIELPEPIEYDTRTVELSGEWNARRGGLRFGVNVSSFNNDYNTMTYDNPWRASDSTDSSAYSSPGSRSIGGPSLGLNVLAPDNTAGRVFVAGHGRFGKGGWYNGNVSVTRMEQDDPLVAHTVNTAINPTVTDPTIVPPFDASDPANLPRATAEQRVDVLHFTANAGYKFNDWASVKVRARYYDYDNKAPDFDIPGYARMDAVWEQIERVTVPYGYTRQKLGVEFGFRPMPKTHIAVGYDIDSMDREFREVKSSDDDVIHVTFDSRAFDNIVLSAAYEHGDRSTSPYMTAAQILTFGDPLEDVNNQFGLRKYDEAERTYDFIRAQAMLLIGDAVSLTVGASSRDDDYEDRVLVPDPTDPDPTRPTLPFVTDDAMGLLSEELTQFDAELSYTPNERVSFFLFAQRTDRETFQVARQSGGSLSQSPLDSWELTLDEATDTFGVGLNGKLGSSWTVDLTGSWSNSDGDSDFFSPPGGTPDTAMGFPEYDDNEWVVYTARFGYDISPSVKAMLTLARDEFTTNRFTRLGLQPYLPGALILDLNDGDYDATIAMLGLRISF